MATIREIAKLAKVSPSTVSRVLNHDSSINVTMETKRKIFKVAESLEYEKPNKQKNNSSNLNFGLMYKYNEEEEISDSFFLSIRLGIEEECRLKNINLIHVNSKTIANNLNGIIFLGRFTTEEIEIHEKLCNNIVLIHNKSKNFNHDCLLIDFREITRDVIDYFISENHSKIAYIGGREKTIINNKTFKFDNDREDEFINYTKKLHIYNENYIYVKDFSIESGYQMTGELIKNAKDLPTAIFAGNDAIAIGILRKLKENNLNIRVVGCNDTPTAKHFSPSISTVRIYTNFLGREAVGILENKIKNPKERCLRYTIPHKLIIRET
ncbi:MAG: LacI family DNA-binding transcriptional regulator [Lachnospirales bacterium]